MCRPHSSPQVHPSLLTVSDEGADPVLPRCVKQSDTQQLLYGLILSFPLKEIFQKLSAGVLFNPTQYLRFRMHDMLVPAETQFGI